MSYLVKLENVTKTYYMGAQPFTALNGIDFCVERCEMLAVVGMSGSGKSTLMNILGFLDRCTTGKYWFLNQDVSSLSDHELAAIRNQKIGFIFQSFFLLPRSSALENVMLPLFYRGVPREVAKEKALHLLDKMGVQHLSHHRPNQLSGGQQQRVAIARALIGDPELILADEPTGALDSQTGDVVMELLLKLNKEEGRTIVIITHDSRISERCGRMVKIKDGKIICNR